MTKVMAEAIQVMMNQKDDERSKAKRRILHRIRNAPDLGTRGVISWTRDELHER